LGELNYLLSFEKKQIMKKIISCLIFCLAFGDSFSQTNKIGSTPYDGNPFMGVPRVKMQYVYSRTELLTLGLTTGSVIDTLCFNITTRNSTLPYNLDINYYYTNPSFCYASTTFAPVVIAGIGIVFSGLVDMSVAGSYYVPPTGGQLKIPLSPPLVWGGGANSLVFEMCLETDSGQAGSGVGDSICLLPSVCNNVLKVFGFNTSVPACSLMTGNFTFVSQLRPDIFFCSCQTTPTNFPIAKNNLLTIEKVFYSDNLLKVKFYSPAYSKFDLRILDVTGRIVCENKNLSSVDGENTIDAKAVLNKGVYFVELHSKDGNVMEKFFCE
jgi:hypothetical protein